MKTAVGVQEVYLSSQDKVKKKWSWPWTVLWTSQWRWHIQCEVAGKWTGVAALRWVGSSSRRTESRETQEQEVSSKTGFEKKKILCHLTKSRFYIFYFSNGFLLLFSIFVLRYHYIGKICLLRSCWKKFQKTQVFKKNNNKKSTYYCRCCYIYKTGTYFRD